MRSNNMLENCEETLKRNIFKIYRRAETLNMSLERFDLNNKFEVISDLEEIGELVTDLLILVSKE